jgi:hypothetical protein
MFVFGGEAPAGTFNQREAYDARNNGWSTHARMPTARHGLGAAVVAGNLGRGGGHRRPAPQRRQLRRFSCREASLALSACFVCLRP